MIKIYDKYFVGFNKRTLFDDDATSRKFLLAYIVRDKSFVSFDQWRDKHIKIEEIDNQPKGGFKLFGETQRGRDWFGSGRSMVYVQHPNGFVFEISVDNLLNITETCDIVGREFVTKVKGIQLGSAEFIIAHEGTKLILVPTNAELYKKALEDTHRSAVTKTKSVVKPSDLKLGDEIEFGNREKAIYLGRYESIAVEAIPPSEDEVSVRKWLRIRPPSKHQTVKKGLRHFYITGSDDKKHKYDCRRIESVQSIKVFRVVKKGKLTQAEALKLCSTCSQSWDKFYPVIEGSKIEIGVGKADGGFNGTYWVQDFAVTLPGRTSDVELVFTKSEQRESKSPTTNRLMLTFDPKNFPHTQVAIA